MLIRSTLVLMTLVLPLAAQEAGDAKAASTRSGAAAVFYEAYFLDNDQARSTEATKKALALYTRFLAANPKHDLAGKAASRAAILYYSLGDLEGGRAFAKKHAELISVAEEAAVQARRGGARGNPAVTAKLREAMQNARDGGDNAELRRIMGAMRRTGAFGRGFGGRGQGGRGFGGRRGGAGGGRRGANIPKIAELKQEDAKKAVATFVTSMERTIDMMAQRGQADQADKLEAKLDKVQDLVDDGKMAEAQKILDSLQADIGGAFGRRGRGGEQGGGRRRRGGEGGERRRRGGDAGEGGEAGGERRRRR